MRSCTAWLIVLAALSLAGCERCCGDSSAKPGNQRKILVDKLDATFVKQVDGGYLVRLFEQAHCGCGKHETSANDYLVTSDGRVSEQKSVKVYDDPGDDGLCVD